MAAAEPAPHRATASKAGAAKKPPTRGGATGDADLTAVPSKGGPASRAGAAAPKVRAKSPRSRPAAKAATKTGNAVKAATKPAGVTAPAVDEAVPELEGGPAAEDLADVEVEVEVEEITADAEEAEAQSGPGGEDFVWDEEESEALRQARKDAELTASADSVRAYLKQIGKVALLNAEEEVELAKRIEAGLHAAERVRKAEDTTEKLSPQMRRDLRWIVRDGERAKNHLLEANL
ncbi:MAG: sigma-70 factor domain-containing protein, partial [Pseudonocardiaceae bacterium]